MEMLSFILGAGMVVGLLTGVFVVRIYREVQTLKEQLSYHITRYEDSQRTLWEEFDRKNRFVEDQLDELNRQMDSRFDRFENKISKKQVLND